MRKVIFTFAVLVMVSLIAMPIGAQTYSNTYYGQEGTASDGYAAINAAGLGPKGDVTDNYTNWKAQWGSAAYSAIYSWDGDAWLVITDTGDASIEVECDIEMYWSETIANNKVYFHIGNPFTATTSDKRAVVNGTYATNHPMWWGISFDGTSKSETDFEKDTGGNYTGKILGGMVGTVDIGGRDISAESFDISFLSRINGGAWGAPDSYGDGAHSTIHDTLWWDPVTDPVHVMTLGNGTFDYLIEIHPGAAQPDGNYHLDPVLTRAPML